MKYNLHHQCPKSKWGVRSRYNLLKLPIHVHTNYHRVFGNDDVKEAIIRILDQYNPTCLSDTFRNDIMKILKESDLDYYYKNWILLPKE